MKRLRLIYCLIFGHRFNPTYAPTMCTRCGVWRTHEEGWPVIMFWEEK